MAEMEGRPFTAEKSLDDAMHEILVQSMKEHLKSFGVMHKDPLAVSAQQGIKLMIRLVEEIYPYKDNLSSNGAHTTDNAPHVLRCAPRAVVQVPKVREGNSWRA